MSTHPALRRAAAGHVTRSGPERRRPLSTADQLERLTPRFDALVRDARLGTPTHREWERQCAEAEAIAGKLRAMFREPTPAQPQNPVLSDDGDGRVWL